VPLRRETAFPASKDGLLTGELRSQDDFEWVERLPPFRPHDMPNVAGSTSSGGVLIARCSSCITTAAVPLRVAGAVNPLVQNRAAGHMQ
jgi:hypothetical protein